LVITTQAKLAAKAQAIAPTLVARMFQLVNRFLPSPVTEVEERRAA